MPTKPVRGVGQRTAKDEQRRLDRIALHEHWAEIDAQLLEVLGPDDDGSTPRVLP